MKKLIVPKKNLITRRNLLRAFGIAAPAIITLPRLADAQFNGCPPGFCSPSASLGPCSPTDTFLLMQFDGTNGSNVFPDSSSYAWGNAGLQGSPVLDTSVKQWGTASLNCNAGSATYPVAGGGVGPRWYLGTSWCIEVYVLWASTAPNDEAIIGCWSGIGFGSEYTWMLYTGSGGDAGKLIFFTYDGVVSQVSLVGPVVPGTAAGWQYYCIESNGTKARMYIGSGAGGNATMVASSTPATTQCGNFAAGIGMGAGNEGGGRPFHGHIDSLRFTRNCFRYNTDTSYPVPSGPFT